MTQYNERENSDWDADGDYDRKHWIKERADELIDDGYSKATAYIKATREYSEIDL